MLAPTNKHLRTIVTVVLMSCGVSAALFYLTEDRKSLSDYPPPPPEPIERVSPRFYVDTSGLSLISTGLHWGPSASLPEIKTVYDHVSDRIMSALEKDLKTPGAGPKQMVGSLVSKAIVLNYEGRPMEAYDVIGQARGVIEKHSRMRVDLLSTITYLQGLTALRRGENENCILCRGESSCILPISAAAQHRNPEGSTLAIQHFTEHLERFPQDREVAWLLNLAHMTLGTYPDGVDPRFRIPLDRFANSEFDIGQFRDVGHLVGVNQLSQAGGVVMDDFDNDGLLDLVVTSWSGSEGMSFLRNTGTGTFENCTRSAGLQEQFGGLNCTQADFNNDGYLDVLVMRGAWLREPVRPSFLRNNQDGTFTDVTDEVGLNQPVNSPAAAWGDYDNDGWIDLFLCCERQPSRLFHNENGKTFRDATLEAGISIPNCGKGAVWIDYDNNGTQDLYVSMLGGGKATLFRNQGDRTFSVATHEMGIDGPKIGFSCWAFDFNNDGWLDIFSTCYERDLDSIVRGIVGEPHLLDSSRLYMNRQGQQFQDVADAAGIGDVYSTMGSNFGDFDNDGFLDFYLGTGEPDYSTLVPNRMFRNVGGQRFSEITASARTGNLQKGHGVACGDWDRDGDIDIFIEMGGAVPGDQYHNILFQNPRTENHWLTVKLVGEKTNRAAIGARIKVVTDGPEPQTIYRWVSSGSSFGGNPLEQTIGIGDAKNVALLEVHWPTSDTTQSFHDVEGNQSLTITEFQSDYERAVISPIPLPKE